MDQREFRSALGRFPTGVAVVTAQAPGGARAGVTVSSFNSVSLDPPLVLWSLARCSPSLAVFEAARFFCINVLGEDGIALSKRFATPASDKFAGLALRDGLGGAPVLEGSVASFECASWQAYDGGDHVIFVGLVERFARGDGAPLLFCDGRYGAVREHPALAAA